jgi:glycosyltransferase involved in cell wall biosynthesis
MQSISLVIPCYNESPGIDALVSALNSDLKSLEHSNNVQFDLVFIDDGSRDGSFDKLRGSEIAFDYQLVSLSRNFGKEAALTAGLEFVKSDAAILFDADLQHPISLIEQMIHHWRSGQEVVYTYKQDRSDESVKRQLLAKAFYGLVNFGSRVEIPMNAGDFRLLDRKVIDAILKLPESQRFMKGLYAWVGFKQFGIPMEIDERADGEASKFSSLKLIGLALDGITSFSIAPIRMMSLVGMGAAGFSLLYMLWILFEWFFLETPFSGFASIAVLISFFGGLQLLTIGLIGEYVSKTLIESKNRPAYLVSSHEVYTASQLKAPTNQ